VRVVSLALEPGAWETRERLVRPAVVLQVALFLLVVGNLGRIPVLDLGERQAPLLINDLCLVAVLAAGALAMVRSRSMRLDDVAIAAIAFAMLGGLTAVAAVPRFGLTAMELIGSLAYLARWLVYFALYLVVINCAGERDVEPLWAAAEWAVLLIAAFGIVQAIFLPNFAFIVYPDARELLDWDPQRHRLVSTVLEPNIVAGMLMIMLLVQLARLSCGVRVALWKPALLFAALIMTLSRSGIGALLVGGGVLLCIVGLRKRLIAFAATMGVLVLAALPKLIEFGAQYARFGVTDPSALARVATWQRALATFIDHPWFGIGFNTYAFVQERRGVERLGTSAYSAEGGLLFIAVMTGIVGLVVYLTLLWFVLSRCRRGWRDSRATREERGLFIGTAAATVAILAHSVFVNSLFMPFVMELLWVAWGLTFVISTSLQRRLTAAI
jgi:O-antigen ligase